MRRLLALVAATLVACGPAGSRSEPTAAPPAGVTSAPPTATASAAPTSREALLTKVLKDVRSGEEFTLGQFSGRVTLVQHMAVW